MRTIGLKETNKPEKATEKAPNKETNKPEKGDVNAEN